MRQLFITGANSLLGRELLTYLAKERLFDQVFALTRGRHALPFGQAVTYPDFFEGKVASGPSSVLLHLAFARSSEPEDLLDSIRLLEKVSAAAARRGLAFVNISSQSVYDPYRAAPARETDLPAPQGLYGVFKYYGESYLEDLAKRGDLRVVNLRLASLMGPGMEARITTRLLKAAVQEGVVRIQSGGEAFSYLHLSDAARMLAQIAAGLGRARHVRYNVGNHEYYSLRQVAERIDKLLLDQGRAKADLVVSPLQGPAYNNRMVLDKLVRDFGLKADIGLEATLKADFERLFR